MKKWRCTVCKRVFEGDAPPVPCPVCGAGLEAFVSVEDEAQPAAPAYRRDTSDDYLIIGGGIAALEAARAIRQRDATGSITILSGERHLPYNRPGLPTLIAGGCSMQDLFLEPESFYPAQHIQVKLGALATGIDPCSRQVTLATGESLPYTKLLLATGANPFNPIKSAHGSVPVKVLRCFEDAMDLAGFSAGRKVVLVGGGILGLEAAIALHARGAKVTVVEFANRILPIQTDLTVSRLLSDHLRRLGIELVCGGSVAESVASGALLADGATLPADLILASMGVRSQVDLAVAIGLELGRGIQVDSHMHTSREGIWAAGDCAEFGGRVMALAGAAGAMGAVAGASMAGDDTLPYQPFTPATLFEMPGFSLFSAGTVGTADEAAETVVRQNPATGGYAKLLFSAGRLSGALYTGPSPGVAVLDALKRGDALADALKLLA